MASSCTRAIHDEYLAPYQIGQLNEANAILDEKVDSSIPNRQYEKSKDAVLLLLDRATIRFASGDTKGAIQDYQLAIEAIDYYNQTTFSEKLAQIALQDDFEAYSGKDFEQVLARVYFALALLQKNDETNALALLKQCEEIQQRKLEMNREDCLKEYDRVVENPLAKYLMALLLEHKGDLSNAKILYEKAESLIGCSLSSLQLNPLECGENNATVLIVAHNGNAPYKISGISDASLASVAAMEMLLHCSKIPPSYLGITGIPVPILMQKVFSQRVPICTRICKQEKNLNPIYNITHVAAEQLKQEMPLILARGVARYVLRRGALAYIKDKDSDLAPMADVTFFIANFCTQADTRSWRTLPSSIDLARYTIPAGEHTLHLQVEWGVVPSFIEEFSLILNPHDLCVINVFNIHPGIALVQIPEIYKNKKEFCYETLHPITTSLILDADQLPQQEHEDR